MSQPWDREYMHASKNQKPETIKLKSVMKQACKVIFFTSCFYAAFVRHCYVNNQNR